MEEKRRCTDCKQVLLDSGEFYSCQNELCKKYELRVDKFNYFRCIDEQRIITSRQIRQGVCVGHRLKAAGYVTPWEWFLIKIRVIR